MIKEKAVLEQLKASITTEHNRWKEKQDMYTEKINAECPGCDASEYCIEAEGKKVTLVECRDCGEQFAVISNTDIPMELDEGFSELQELGEGAVWEDYGEDYHPLDALIKCPKIKKVELSHQDIVEGEDSDFICQGCEEVQTRPAGYDRDD